MTKSSLNQPASPPRGRLRRLASAMALGACLLLAACDVDLHTNLTEAEANEILAVLLANGVSANKTAVGETFTVRVDEGDMLKSISMLNERGLPRTQRSSMGVVFQKSGIMSSPFEERVRYIYALGEEVAQTLSEIDGVVTARVHIVLPQEPELGQPVKPSSAAVFIKYQPGVDLDFFVPQIRRLVSSSIEGLEYAAVTVVLSEAQQIKTESNDNAPAMTSVLPGVSVMTADLGTVWNYIYATVAAFLIALVAIGALAYRLVRRPPGKSLTDAGKAADMMEPT